MDPFYYLQPLPSVGEACCITEDEARHLGASRRQKVGDEIMLFDGHGNIARARIETIEARGSEVHCSILQRESQRPRDHKIFLACAMPKGDRQRFLLDAVTQLGVDIILPLQCERSNTGFTENQCQRWQRIVLEACKQCRRAWLPVIETATIDTALQRMQQESCHIYLADPRGNAALHSAEAATGFFVGPEGGFTESEINSIRHAGAKAVSLGSNILRVEVAAVSLLARML